MPYRAMDKDALCAYGSNAAGDEELTTGQAFEAGLNTMEREEWALVQVVPATKYRIAGGETEWDDVQYIFHQPAKGEFRLLV